LTIKIALETSAVAMDAFETRFNRLRESGAGEGVANDGCHDDEWEDECLHNIVVLV
jgi:hypothetical protein